jgi:hypothetical protein
MKKLICIITLLCAVSFQANAQDLKSILSGIAQKVVGDKATTATSILGTWKYVKPDCQFQGDNLLTNAGGEVAAASVEEKLEGVMNKVGINNIQFTFNEDGTFMYTIKSKKANGTYVFDAEAKTITMKLSKLNLNVTAHIVTLGSNMSFVFNADKLMSVLKTITGAAAKVNSTASTINSLAENFNGLMLGFEMTKI